MTLAQIEEETLRALVSAGVRARYYQAHPLDFKPKIAEAAIGDLSVGWVIYGKPGRGKTHLAAGIMRAHILSGKARRPIFRMAREILRRIRETNGSLAQERESDVLADLCGASLLVVDELGRESTAAKDDGPVSEFVLGALHEMISRRLDDLKPTIFTTNLDDAEIESRYGGAVMSRLTELQPLMLQGPDRRGG